MKKAIGIFLIALPFIVVFGFGVAQSWEATLFAFVTTILIVGCVSLGVELIG